MGYKGRKKRDAEALANGTLEWKPTGDFDELPPIEGFDIAPRDAKSVYRPNAISVVTIPGLASEKVHDLFSSLVDLELPATRIEAVPASKPEEGQPSGDRKKMEELAVYVTFGAIIQALQKRNQPGDQVLSERVEYFGEGLMAKTVGSTVEPEVIFMATEDETDWGVAQTDLPADYYRGFRLRQRAANQAEFEQRQQSQFSDE